MDEKLLEHTPFSVRKHLLLCNKRLFMRVGKRPWFYLATLIFLTFAVQVPSVLVSSGAIPVPPQEREMWDYPLSYMLFAVANFLFWVRIYTNTSVTLLHLFPFPLSARSKFALLLSINLTDHRAFAYLSVILAFILSSPGPHTSGLGMGLLCLLFYLCIEIWLLNLHLAGLPLFCKYINLGYFLAVIPVTAFWIAGSFQLYQLFQTLPFTVWIAAGFQAARTQDWMSYALHLTVLLPVAAAGVALGSFLCTQTYLLSARGIGASE